MREWLINSGVELGEVLSLDGKTLRGIHGEEIPGVHLVSAYAVRCGAVLAQAATPGKGRVERRRTVKGRVRVEVSYAVTSLSPTVAGADRLLRILQEHWHIENRVHWVRDVTSDEDRSQIRNASAPQVMAALRNLTTTLVRRTGHSNVAAALRRHVAHLSEALALLGIACYPGK